ncbi:hypothetical protein SERLA73DRAFT_175337 [Serpula lacrymans var. lacrymans S7.3]|uniref:Uncharacterized protein n=2 Tax=Serpula lacrymans var. lacrymans TaxID=341189 RepID=F8PJA3_SERL3|nr:uncharacterized protein SERLADRAFT_457550 [Serpula lacrymans var. lacrymans S7.9]EGO03728.1 hypothetical protein SERLA73DRAFT_175337 [Serpula lacrymans var. lacrymans S7.3]EGO29593.1 hypothetical protein SERLADRAFT_457550 [Serpula lacrymans var. lacrymans S7.9]
MDYTYTASERIRPGRQHFLFLVVRVHRYLTSLLAMITSNDKHFVHSGSPGEKNAGSKLLVLSTHFTTAIPLLLPTC